MGCGGSTAATPAVDAAPTGKGPVTAPSQAELHEAARKADATQVQSMLEAGAQPDALFRGIAISRGINAVIPAAA
jgi:hypothetical protein